MTRSLSALLALLLLATVWGTLPAQALDSSPAGTEGLRIELERIEPAIATPGAELTVTGAVRNTGDAAVPITGVQLHLAYRGLDTRDQVAAWGDGRTALTLTRELGRTELVTTVVPGALVPFRVEVPGEVVQPPFDFATLPLAIEVTGAGDPGASATPGPGSEEVTGPVLAELRTFLPWDGQTDYDHKPLALGWLLPLTLPGDADLVATDEGTRDDAWAAATGPDSPAARLLTQLRGTPVTFLVDPALTQRLDPVAGLAVAPDPDDPDDDADPTADPPAATPASPTATPSPAPPTTTSAGAGTGDLATATPDTGDLTTGTAPPTGPSSPEATEQPDDSVDPPLPGEPEEPRVPTDLREALAALPPGKVWWLPVSDPDLTALHTGGLDADAAAALLGDRRAPATGPVTDAQPPLPLGRSDVAWPVLGPGEVPDPEFLAQLWPTLMPTPAGDPGTLGAIVLPGSSLTHPGLLTPSAAYRLPSGTAVLGYDEGLSALILHSGPTAPQDSVTTGAPPAPDGHAVQRVLAETLAIYQEQPATPRTLLVATPREALPDPDTVLGLLSALGSAPWVQPVPASTVLLAALAHGEPTTLAEGEAPVPDPADPTAYPLPGDSPLTGDRISRVESTRVELAAVAEVVPEATDPVQVWGQVLDHSYSTGWRQQPEDWGVPVDQARDIAREVLTGVEINPTTINFLADEGLIQITVTNTLPVTVSNLQVRMTPANPRLQVVEQPPPVTIGPNSRATVRFPARALAAGTVEVTTELSTPSGVPVGDPEVMRVRVQPTGAWIYWVLGGIAGIILVLGLWRALRPAPKPAPAEEDDG